MRRIVIKYQQKPFGVRFWGGADNTLPTSEIYGFPAHEDSSRAFYVRML